MKGGSGETEWGNKKKKEKERTTVQNSSFFLIIFSVNIPYFLIYNKRNFEEKIKTEKGSCIIQKYMFSE